MSRKSSKSTAATTSAVTPSSPARPTGPAPITEAKILEILELRKEYAHKQLTEQLTKFRDSIVDDHWLGETIANRSEGLVTTQATHAAWVYVFQVLNYHDDDASEASPTPFIERLMEVAKEVNKEIRRIVSSQAWERNSSNSISNVMDRAKLSGKSAVWVEVSEMVGAYLDERKYQIVAGDEA